jgi:broad-specificity NMP kinase
LIVEFIGSTGAGKTTLFSEVRSRLAETSEAVGSFDLISELTGLPRVSHPTLQNLVGDTIGFPFLFRSLRHHKEFICFVLEVLKSHSNISFSTLNSLRSIIRQIGIHQLIRQREGNRIVLVDEGTVLAAHNLFVFTSTLFDQGYIAEFVRLVPLPDVVIYVRAPLDHLVRRTLARGDPPREMSSKNPELIERYLRRASTVFEQVIETREIRDKVLVVDNTANGSHNRTAVASRITRFILSCASSGRFGPVTSLQVGDRLVSRPIS